MRTICRAVLAIAVFTVMALSAPRGHSAKEDTQGSSAGDTTRMSGVDAQRQDAGHGGKSPPRGAPGDSAGLAHPSGHDSESPRQNGDQHQPSGAAFLVVYDESDASRGRLWDPSDARMPPKAAIWYRDACDVDPRSGKTCIEVGYQTSSADWAGMYWLRGGSWGGVQGPNLLDSLRVERGDPVRLTFWVRGRDGGERVDFRVGGMSKGKYPDSIRFPLATGHIRLPSEWTKLTIDLTGQDLTQMSSAFCWVAERAKNRGRAEVWFYLDDIVFEVYAREE
jgi:hypothetical protein